MDLIDVPIVVVAFNKQKPLSRLLSSLHRAHYTVPVKLIISIDGGGSAEVQQVAEEFEWVHGEKEVIVHLENKGLRNHILYCGGLSQKYQGVLLLEDDLLVSPWFYQYALEVVPPFESEENVCGIALYSPGYNETSYMPFRPLSDGTDCYFMQLPCSWGQIWLKAQWKEFASWYEAHQGVDVFKDSTLPHNIKQWPESSWKKYFVQYMLETEKFFLYPYDSFTTNCGDLGQHHTGTHLFQVPLTLKKEKMVFKNFNESQIKYDTFCEMQPESLKILSKNLTNYDFDVDVHGTKDINLLDKDYILTSKKCNNYIKSFGKSLVPIENNIIASFEGNEIYFAERKYVESIANIGEYIYKKSNDFEEQCYYHSFDKIHFSIINNEIELLKKDNDRLYFDLNILKNEYNHMKINFESARDEADMLRNSHSFRIGNAIVLPLSWVKGKVNSFKKT